LKIIDFFLRGGPVMWPLLLCSLVSLTVTVERFIFWQRQSSRKSPALIDRIIELAAAGRIREALDLKEGNNDGAARLLLGALQKGHREPAASLELAAAREIEEAKRGLGILDTIITMSPLLGILGTVTGIIGSFDLLGAQGIADPRAVTGGIAQALITTASGLTVALLTLLPHNYLRHRVQKEAGYLSEAASRLEAACKK
jgi:biopolymer transport protein ExbB